MMEEKESELRVTDNLGDSEVRLPWKGAQIPSRDSGAQRGEFLEHSIETAETVSRSEYGWPEQESINLDLMEAAESGDHEGVSGALDNGADITCRDGNGDTGLHVGAWKGYKSVVKTFLKKGIDVNIRGEGDTKWTALINAACSNKISCVQILLDNAADPNIRDFKNGHTALMYAALQNKLEIVAELLMKGANDKILSNAQKSALQLAREENAEDIVKLLEAWGDQEALNKEMLAAAIEGRGRLLSGLLRAGADLRATDEEGRTGLSLLNTGLMIAAKEGSAENIILFTKAGADVETKDETEVTGLDIALKRGHRAAAEAFLDHGITGYNREDCLHLCDKNREKIDELNKTLISAVKSGDNPEVKAVLAKGAETNSRDINSHTGLHWSALLGHQSVLLTLLKRGLDPNIRGCGENTSLMDAAERGHLTCVQTLLEHGALTDLKNKFGDTALMKAADRNYPDIVGELLARQADVNIVNYRGKTALQLAQEKNNQLVVRILKAGNNKEILNKHVLKAAAEGMQRLIHCLINAGADLETEDNDGNTALHISVKKGHESVVRTLLQRGIDVNIRGSCNCTPLMTASEAGQHRIVKLLVRSGAGLNLQDSWKRTALMLAARRGHTGLLCDLLEAGADRDIKDDDNRTALQYAHEEGHHVIAIILDRGNIQADNGNGAKAVLAATEAGCPKGVSDLLARGASMDTKNDVGETLFQIAARLPKTRKDQFEEYLKEVKRRREIKPTETKDNVLKEAEEKSRELAKVFLSESLHSHDPTTISKYLFDIMNFVNKEHFKCSVFGDKQKFYLNYDKEEGKETLLQSVVDKGKVKDREEVLGVMKKVDIQRYPNEQEDAGYRLKKQVLKACSSSVGLRDCIQSIDEKYPWGKLTHKFKIFLSFLTFCIGTLFYGLDIYTDIKFSLDMYNYSKRNFTQELSLCQMDFDKRFSLTINECKNNFEKIKCLNSLAVVKKMADDCFDNEERFTDPNDWWIAGTVSSFHCALPILIGFILWGVLQIGQKCSLKSLQYLPLPFVTRWFKFRLDGELFRNYAWPDRNKSPEYQTKYETKVKQCSENLDAHNQIVNLSLIIESSVEASFQFFFQTVYVFPTIILGFTDVSGTSDWKDLFNWKTFSIVLSFASFAWAFYVIR